MQSQPQIIVEEPMEMFDPDSRAHTQRDQFGRDQFGRDQSGRDQSGTGRSNYGGGQVGARQYDTLRVEQELSNFGSLSKRQMVSQINLSSSAANLANMG